MWRIKYFTASRKNFKFMLLETARRALTRRNIKWLLTRIENYFKSNQICFYSNLGKVFQLPEFQAKLFFKRNWVGGTWRDSLLSVIVRKNRAGPEDRSRPFTFVFSQYKSYPKRSTTMIFAEVGVGFFRHITRSWFWPLKRSKMAELSGNLRWA